MGLAELANAAILSRPLLEIENRNVVVPSLLRHDCCVMLRCGVYAASLKMVERKNK
jgi:hypothetical protein